MIDTVNIINSIRIWFRAVRAFSFTASIVPVCLGAALVSYFNYSFNWILFPLVLIASVSIHAASNLLSDYFDYKNDVDKDYTFGSSGLLVEGLLKPNQILFASLTLFALTALVGLVFIIYHGWIILAIGLFGMAGGFFYCAGPIGYKYRGLGDLMVFILMGPLMVLGSFYVLSGLIDYRVVMLSLPVGFLVTAILSSNNLRDINHDSQACIKTLAIILGPRLAKIEYALLLISAYISIIIFILISTLPWYAILVFLTIPIAIKNIHMAIKSNPDSPSDIASLDVNTAKLHLLFGIIYIFLVLLA